MTPGQGIPAATIDLSRATSAEVVDYLAARALDVGPGSSVEKLTGGVSGTVIKIRGAHRDLILKQALADLAVPRAWHADRRRSLTEARALELLHGLTPSATAELVDVDPEALTLTMTCAPSSWSSWKEQLLAGPTGARAEVIGRRLGQVLAAWHQHTTDPQIRSGFSDHPTFRSLRSDPFYRALGTDHPALSDTLHDLADHLDDARICLVHGDFSPKNVLTPVMPDSVDTTGGDGGQVPLWVVDHEVMVQGDPVFDLAFMLCHLSCKSVDPQRRSLVHTAAAFVNSYRDHDGLPVDDGSLAAHTAALMLARVDGVSQVNYLDATARDLIRGTAAQILGTPGAGLAELWSALQEGTAR